MRTKPTLPARKPRKDLVEIIEAKQPFDVVKAERARRRASEAADKLLRDMDEFMRTHERAAQGPRKPT
jgi:hypothetical protein